MTECAPMPKCWAGSHRYGLVPALDTGPQGAGPQAGLGCQGPRGLPLRHRQGGGGRWWACHWPELGDPGLNGQLVATATRAGVQRLKIGGLQGPLI